MSRRENDFIDNRADVGSDEEDEEELDEETGEPVEKSPKAKKNKKKSSGPEIEDSSEEEDDDDEEAMRAVREGFIVDEDEDEDEDEEEGGRRHRRKKRKRAHRAEEEEDLDEEDLDLVMENQGMPRSRESHLKRLKRGRTDDDDRRQKRSALDISSDEEDYDVVDDSRANQGGYNDMDDFIEDSDTEGAGGSDDERRRPRPAGEHRPSAFVNEHLGLTEDKIGLMEAVFGNGDDYDYALCTELVDDMVIDEDQIELKDVFEPTDLEERMLTEGDMNIRQLDVPERFQLARRPYSKLPEFDDKTLEEEGDWIAKKMLQWRPKLESAHHTPFKTAVKTVVVFFNKDNYEVPFIYQHRRDFLNYVEKTRAPPGSNKEYDTNTVQLLNRDDLWEIFEWDLKYRSFYEKRAHLRATYEKLGVRDELFDKFNEKLENPETINDLHDYLHFHYGAEIKDAETKEPEQVDEEGNAVQKQRRPRKAKSQFEQVRSGPLYHIVKAFGITANQLAENLEHRNTYVVAEDPDASPEEICLRYNQDSSIDWEQAMWLARNMFIEELYMNPILRKILSEEYFRHGLIHVKPTEKGVKKIDEQHIYYEFKYLRNQPIPLFFNNPALFLRMLKAEEEGLVEIRVEHEKKSRFVMELYEYIMSENQSEIAEQWNRERKEVIDKVMVKFEKVCQKAVKESIKNETEDRVALACRRAFYGKLNQAPYNTSILVKGDVPRVLALSPGMGIPGKDAIVGVFMDENGKVVETLKLVSLKDEASREDLLKVIRNRKPDVIGIAGFSVATHRLKEDLQSFIAGEELMCSENDKAAPLEVIYVDDEMARIFRMSPRGKAEFPAMVPMQRYCIALCRYVQDPLVEYACQGKDILSLSFDPAQHLIPQDKLMRQLESALVDVVNLVGLNINEALKDARLGNLLQYIAGLGPRKAQNIVKVVGASPTGRLNGRTELVGDGVKYAAMDLTVFANCASFLWIEHDKQDENSEVLDGTRIHPEDYELGRKMAADAMEYDEEDVTQLVNSGGPSAVIAELLNGHEDKLNELILEDYADELESNFGQRKRATLETIRDELINPYAELRADFKRLTIGDIFTMLTGETKESLQPGMVVPVNIRKLSERFIAVRLDCGVDGNVASDMMSDNSNFHVYSAFETGQTVQGCIMNMDYEKFYAELSLRGRDTRKLFKPRANDHGPEEWDDQQEEKDKAKLSISNQEKQRTTRVIKHPLFKPFNSRQAEEYLKGMSRGDAVIRPSSNGMDHIAVTWKVNDGIYQHIDVLELDKENEFTVGKTLKVSGKYTYSDLDELIVEHVKAMARKMDEMTSHSKFRNDKTRSETEQFLVSYTQAAPKKSIYTFTFDYKHPGYFILSFKAGRNAPINCWPVKVVPGGFQLKEQAYPDMTSLCNGFKLLYTSSLQGSRPSNGPPRGPPGHGGPPGHHYGPPQQRMGPPPGAYGMHQGGYGMPIRR